MKSLMPQIDSNDGLFHNGNPATGEQGTRVTDTWLNNLQDRVRDVQAEAHYVLQKAGFTPKAETQTQLYQAIVKIIDDNRKTASLTQKGETQLYTGYDSQSEDLALTPKTAYQLKQFIDSNTRALGNVIQNSKKSSAVDSNSADTVATSAAVKTAYDLANGKQSPATTLAGYGIGNFKIENFVGNVNSLQTDGIYAVTQASRSQNLPVAGNGCHIQVIAGGDGRWCRQIAYIAYSTDMYERHQTSYQTDSWSDWKKLNTDGIPIGAVVSFPRAVTNPVGFLKANGTTFNQQTFPDLYQVLGNSNKLPDLTRSDVGMTAYFAVDNIPTGWIAFDEIATQVTEQRYPELYRHLVGKYGSIARVPKVADRFLRNAGNGLSVGQTQEDEFKRHVHKHIEINTASDPRVYNDKTFDYDSRDSTDRTSLDIGTALRDDNDDNWWITPNINSNFATGGAETRPKSLILKLCIKAINSFDDVVFWIKSHGEVTNAGALDAGRLAQGLQAKADSNHTHTASQITDFNQSVREIVTQSITQGFSQNLAETGWCKLPNGMILQWGKFNKGHGFVSDEQRLVTFPITFPNKVFFVGLTEFTNGWSYSTTVDNRQRMTNSGFYVISQRNDSMYFALGF